MYAVYTMHRTAKNTPSYLRGLCESLVIHCSAFEPPIHIDFLTISGIYVFTFFILITAEESNVLFQVMSHESRPTVGYWAIRGLAQPIR